VEATRSGRIGVLATAGTIASGAYPRAVAQLSTRAEVVGQPAPMLVPLAEEGWTEGEVPRLVVRRYVEPLASAGVDVVVLGCTHYPLLRGVIEAEVRAGIGPQVAVVDSALATAADVRTFLDARGLARSGAGDVKLLVTDVPRAFREVATRFLGDAVTDVEQVDL
jgi:glutamate racemase